MNKKNKLTLANMLTKETTHSYVKARWFNSCMLSNMAMIEGAGFDYYFPLVKHIYSGNAFANRLPLTPLPYQLGQATEHTSIN